MGPGRAGYGKIMPQGPGPAEGAGAAHGLNRRRGAREGLSLGPIRLDGQPAFFTGAGLGKCRCGAERLLELVTPLVARFRSQRCSISGDIVEAGGGYFAKVQTAEGQGVRLDPRPKPSPEMIAERCGQISDMSGARPVALANEQMQAALAPRRGK